MTTPAAPSPPRTKRFRPFRKLFWLVFLYALGAYSWPYLRPFVEPYLEPARVWLVERLGGTATPPPLTGETELKKTYLARLRIEVERPETSTTAFVYVENRLIGPADRVHEVSVSGEATSYRMRVVGLNSHESAPFSMHETVVNVKPGEVAPVRLKIPSGSSIRSPSASDCSARTGSIYDLKARVGEFQTIRLKQADNVQQARNDLLWKQFSKNYDALIVHPPAENRLFCRDVPVWIMDGSNVKETKVDLELRPEQIRASGHWLALKYDLTVMTGAMEQMSSSLRLMSEAARGFRDQDSLTLISGEYTQTQSMLAQNKPFVVSFETTYQNLAQLLEEANREQ